MMKTFIKKFYILLVAEILAMVVAYNIQEKIMWDDWADYDYEAYEKNKKYEERDFWADEWNYDSKRKAVFYIPENRKIREWEVNGLDREVIRDYNIEGYAIIDDGNESNLFGPDGNPVFEEDFKNGLLTFVHKNQLICNRMTGDYYDLQGQSVSNIYTIVDWMKFNNSTALYISIYAIFFVLTFILWYFLLWKRRRSCL